MLEYSVAGWREGQLWAHEAAIAPWLGFKMESDGPYKDNHWEWLGKETQHIPSRHCPRGALRPREPESGLLRVGERTGQKSAFFTPKSLIELDIILLKP